MDTMIKDADEGELQFLKENVMPLFRDSGCRLVLPNYSETNILIGTASGHYGISAETGSLGFRFSADYAKPNFPIARINLFSLPNWNENFSATVLGENGGAWSYFIFSTAENLKNSKVYGNQLKRVPQRFLKDLGALISEE